MNQFTNEELLDLLQKATSGDKKSLETIVLGVQDLVFNLSLRMLGTFHDAEDATQDILLKVITHLSSFKGESLFSTWVFSIATNHLKNYQKHRINPARLDFTTAVPKEMLEFKEAMEEIDGISHEFSFCKTYQSPEGLKKFMQDFLNGPSFSAVKNA